MNYAYIANAVVLAAVIAATLYDIKWTLKGIAKGVGVEANVIITKLAGTVKPSFRQLLLINLLIPILPLGLPGLVLGWHNGPLCAFSITALLPGIYTHIHGARDWQYLLKGGNPNLLNTSWWSKIL